MRVMPPDCMHRRPAHTHTHTQPLRYTRSRTLSARPARATGLATGHLVIQACGCRPRIQPATAARQRKKHSLPGMAQARRLEGRPSRRAGLRCGTAYRARRPGPAGVVGLRSQTTEARRTRRRSGRRRQRRGGTRWAAPLLGRQGKQGGNALATPRRAPSRAALKCVPLGGSHFGGACRYYTGKKG